jgi:hypothetical protein
MPFAHEMNEPYRYPWGRKTTRRKNLSGRGSTYGNVFSAGARNVICTWSPHVAYPYWDPTIQATNTWTGARPERLIKDHWGSSGHNGGPGAAEAAIIPYRPLSPATSREKLSRGFNLPTESRLRYCAPSCELVRLGCASRWERTHLRELRLLRLH